MHKLQPLWDIIESIDQKHLKIGATNWEIKEIDTIYKKVEPHFKGNVKFGEYDYTHVRKIQEILREIARDIDTVDFITINTLKDRIHMIIKNAERKDEKFEANIYGKTEVDDFNRKLFYNTTNFGHGVEAEWKAQERRTWYFYEFLMKHNEEVADEFLTLLHDMEQVRQHGRLHANFIDYWIEFNKLGYIDTKQLIELIKLASLSIHRVIGDDFSEDDKKYNLWITLRYLKGIKDFDQSKDKKVNNNGYYLTEEEIYGSVNCSSGNCNIRCIITEDEFTKFGYGVPLPIKYCNAHKHFDENGHHYGSPELHGYSQLPEAPCLLRWLGIDKDEDKSWKKGIRDRALKFIDEHQVELVLERKEYFLDGHLDENRTKVHRDTGGNTWDYNTFYLKFNDNKTLKKFIETFDSDFNSNCHAPEVIDEEILKLANDYTDKDQYIEEFGVKK